MLRHHFGRCDIMPEGSAGISGDCVRARDTRPPLLYDTSPRGLLLNEKNRREGLTSRKGGKSPDIALQPEVDCIAYADLLHQPTSPGRLQCSTLCMALPMCIADLVRTVGRDIGGWWRLSDPWLWHDTCYAAPRFAYGG